MVRGASGWSRSSRPIAGGRAAAGHQHDGRAARTVTLQVELAAPDVDQSREITAVRDRRRNRGRGGLGPGRAMLCGDQRRRGETGGAGPERGAARAAATRQKHAIQSDLRSSVQAILLVCHCQLRSLTMPTPSHRSRETMVHVLQEPDVRPVRHASPGHRLLQIVGVDEEACPLEVVPLQEEQDLIRIGGAAKEPSTLRAIGPASGLVLVEDRLPGRSSPGPCGG